MSVVICDSVVHLSKSGPHEYDSQLFFSFFFLFLVVSSFFFFLEQGFLFPLFCRTPLCRTASPPNHPRALLRHKGFTRCPEKPNVCCEDTFNDEIGQRLPQFHEIPLKLEKVLGEKKKSAKFWHSPGPPSPGPPTALTRTRTALRPQAPTLQDPRPPGLHLF